MEKVAIVTGGSRGIGKAIVEKLARNNYKVILNYNKSTEAAQNVQKCLEKEGFIVDIIQGDVSKIEDVKRIVQFAYDKYKKIDLLVNNAGIDFNKMVIDTTDDEFDNIINVNLKSAFMMSRETLNYMLDRKEGNIINISSIFGEEGASCECVYSMSKAGMDGLTKSLAKEYGGANIRVNSISPGVIDTDMNKECTLEELKAIYDNIPLPRIGKPEDIADAVLLLEESKYITGQVIRVNGGWLI